MKQLKYNDDFWNICAVGPYAQSHLSKDFPYETVKLKKLSPFS